MSCVCPGGWGTVLYSRIRRREVYMEGGSLPCVLLVCSMTSGGRKGGGLYIYFCVCSIRRYIESIFKEEGETRGEL